MPQMAPILWLPLFMIMITSLILMQASSYFKPELKHLSSSLSHKTKNNYNWKW